MRATPYRATRKSISQKTRENCSCVGSVHRQATNGSFKTIVRGTTGDGGSFALEFNPSKRAVVRVRFPGDASHGASESKPATVNVRPQLSWTRPSPQVAPGALVTVPGAIAPRKSSVRLVVERRSGKGRKGRVASVAAKAGTGKYNARIRLKTAGLATVLQQLAEAGWTPSHG